MKKIAPVKILVIHVHSSRNAGDAALLAATLDQLYARFPGAVITLAMNEPASFSGRERAIGSFTWWFKTVVEGRSVWRKAMLLKLPFLFLASAVYALATRWGTGRFRLISQECQQLLDAYAEADLIVSCPGNYFYSSGKLGLPFLFTLWSLGYALMMGKPTYSMPQTVGPLWRRRDRWLVARFFRGYRLLFLRDPRSARLLRSLGLRVQNEQVTPDMAFALQGIPHQAAERLLAERGISLNQPLLGVTAMDWGLQNSRFGRQPEYEAAIAGAVRWFITHYDGAAVFFAQVHGPSNAEDDRKVVARISKQLSDIQDRVFLVTDIGEPWTLQSLYGCMDIFLGTRLHSCIFAMTAGTPALAIAYQSKTWGIYESLGLDKYVIDIDDVTELQLIRKLDRLWAERTLVRSHLHEQIKVIQAQITAIGARIARDFHQLRGVNSITRYGH